MAIFFSDLCVIMKDVPKDVPGYFGGVLECDAAAGGNSTGPNPCLLLDSCFQSPPKSLAATALPHLVSGDFSVDFSDLGTSVSLAYPERMYDAEVDINNMDD